MEAEVDIIHNQVAVHFPTQPLQQLARQIIREEKIPIRELRIIFVDDPYLRDLHRKYLDDDTFTDVMTFNLGSPEAIEGEIYISVDRARDHAQNFGVPLGEEVGRLVIHGLLHLKGYDDHTPSRREEMRSREDYYLQTGNELIKQINERKEG